jgi:hypothetical protein
VIVVGVGVNVTLRPDDVVGDPGVTSPLELKVRNSDRGALAARLLRELGHSWIEFITTSCERRQSRDRGDAAPLAAALSPSKSSVGPRSAFHVLSRVHGCFVAIRRLRVLSHL